MNYKKIISGFTLIEMIIAIGLTGTISAMTASALINMMRNQKFINMKQSVIEDSQVVIGTLSAEIRNNAIDYEEYYNNNKYGYDFGKNYGEYGKEFYDSNGNLTGKIMAGPALECSSAKCFQGHLALISPNGMEKTVYVLKKTDTVSGERVLAVMHLYGCDNNKDGIAEKFLDAAGNCGAEPKSYTIDELSAGVNLFGGLFAPVSSTRTDIVDLRFYITPNNDPHKAYAMPEYVYQPKVGIVLIVKPSKRYFGNTAEKITPITVYKTVSPKSISGVESYKPSYK